MIQQMLSAAEFTVGVTRVLSGVAMALLVYRVVRQHPWPRPFRVRFLFVHLATALATAAAWLAITAAADSLMTGRPFVTAMTFQDRHQEFLLIGCAFYAVIAAVSYAVSGTARAAHAEAAAARTQLAALRAQIEPHFLFNALHTVVQLIPLEPARAIEAAELVADMLRTTMEEDRDVVSLADEWSFVTRYLELERIRFGDRLRVRAELDPELLDVRVPSFALQTLVENAVRHGAAPRVEPTDIVVTAAGTASELRLSVWNTGAIVTTQPAGNGAGTGLRRLKERLAVIHGGAARLAHGPRPEGGFEAVLVLPREGGDQ